MINSYDLKDEEQAKEYLEKIGIEYRFQCYHEKNPEGETILVYFDWLIDFI